MTMVGIVLVSHGEFAKALLASAEMIIGDLAQIASVVFSPGMTPEALREVLTEAIEKVDNGQGILLLADLFGGTPARVISEEVMLRQEMCAVSGMNLPMLLEVIIQREGKPLDQLSEIACDSGREGVIDIKKWLNTME